MNKKLIFLVMPAFILALSFVLTGCGTTSGSKNAGTQLRTTITGIPSEYNGKLGWITFDTGSSRNDPTVAWAMGNISNGSVTFNMLDQKTDRPYSKTGNYFVMFLVWENLDAARARGVDSLYTGIIMSRGIGETNSINFSEFTKM
jgi:predicted small secreted protein